MASELAAAPQLTNGDAVDGHQSSTNGDHVQSVIQNLPVAHTEDALPPVQNSQLQGDPPLSLKEATSTSMDPNPAGPTPVEDVGSGIQPVSDFIPKDASNLSHLTPPPDEPLLTGETDSNVEMVDAQGDAPINEDSQAQLPPVLEPEVSTAPPPLLEPVLEPVSAPISAPISAIRSSPPIVPLVAPISVPAPALTESSLVRPREDDENDAPAAKRSRVADEPREASPSPEPMVTDLPSVIAHDPGVGSVPEPVLKDSADLIAAAPPQPSVEAAPILSAEPSLPQPVDEVKREISPLAQSRPTEISTPAETSTSAAMEPTVPAVPEKVESALETTTTLPQVPADEKPVTPTPAAVAPAPAAAEPATQNTVEAAAPALTPLQTTEPATSIAPAPLSTTVSTAPAPSTAKYDTRPLTSVQKATLLEKMKNLKKTKSSLAFLKPVDPIALNIPNYTEIIKTPMDLSTMEAKLKEAQYTSVQDFVSDFDLMIGNTRRFNGDAHPVTAAGMSLDAYFRRMMETVPSADTPALPPKVPKKRSPSVPRENRRESRNAAVVAAAAIAPPPAPTPAPTATSPTTTYALNSDGTPQLRRDSNRPQRAIKPPQNREITYAKPKRKEHQLELRFCEYVLDEVRSPKYGQMNHVFLQPVDPVALNIPHYRQIVKHPMDLTTMSQKLKGGQYATAGEFRKDFELMIKNCLAFDPVGNPVRDLGIQFQREFDSLWANKAKWEKQNQPASNRASSASADGESADEEEEESDAAEDDKEATIRALQKQLADMQNALSGLGGGKPAKTKKPKAPKTGTKKAGGATTIKAKATTKSAPAKPKKVRQVTYEEKQEISEAVGNMSEQQVTKLTNIITTNCEKYRDMEEMELEIDDLPNDVQAKLLEYVRSIFGKPKKQVREPSPDDAAAIDDDDFEPEHRARGGGGKRKKHKPMGKKEQTDTIRSLQDKLAQFSNSNVGTSGSESPTNSAFRAAHAQAESSGDEESEESEEE